VGKQLSECRVAVVGLGLMGASLCMDLAQKGLCREVRGVARRTDVLLDAFFSQAVDLATDDLHTGVLGADIVILATPVRAIITILQELTPFLWPGTIVMDMGSTKSEICIAMQNLPQGLEPIGGHPMTGKETSGFGAAQPDLYTGATWVLTPLERTSQETIDLATELVEAVHARPVVLPPAEHDRLVASISHLPFLLASALTHAVAEVGSEHPMVWNLAAGGFRDTSRVAASDTQMFLDILSTNRTAVLDQIDSFTQQIDILRDLISSENEPSLRVKLTESKTLRSNWRK